VDQPAVGCGSDAGDVAHDVTDAGLSAGVDGLVQADTAKKCSVPSVPSAYMRPAYPGVIIQAGAEGLLIADCASVLPVAWSTHRTLSVHWPEFAFAEVKLDWRYCETSTLSLAGPIELK
jgi:hypothetical protein